MSSSTRRRLASPTRKAAVRADLERMWSGRQVQDTRYAGFKLAEVVRVLAAHPGDARERACKAVAFLLLRVSPADLPAALRDDYIAILVDVECRRVEGVGGYRRYALTSTTGARIANRIIDLAHEFASSTGMHVI